MHRVKGRENKKAEKNEKERSKKKKMETVQQKKAKFWLMRMRQSKILYIFTWKLHQNLPALSESAFLANLAILRVKMFFICNLKLF